MPRSARFLVGTRIRATRDFGPVVKGQLGVVIGEERSSRWFWRRRYACTFLGGIGATASNLEITRYDHDLPVELLEDPLWFLRGAWIDLPYDPTSAWRLLRHGAKG